MSCTDKMYLTGNPICSNKPQDLHDNAMIIDAFTNSDADFVEDRFGVERKTVAGIEKEASNAVNGFDDLITQRINEKIIAQGGVEIINNWEQVSDENVFSAGFVKDGLGYVTPEMFGAVGDGIVDDTASVQEAISTGLKVVFSKIYKVTQELEVITVGQVLEFSERLYGYGDNALTEAKGNSYLLPRGSNFRKAVRTYRNWRGSSEDPKDPPLSVVLNIQAEGVNLVNPNIWNKDNNANVDIGIFFGCRVGVVSYNPTVLGYFNIASVYYDVTSGDYLPKHIALNGERYPEGTVNNGADGCAEFNPTYIGGNIGRAIVGAKFKPDTEEYSTYYEESVGLVTDNRGSFGFSDFISYGGRVYSTDNPNRQRTRDPISEVLTEDSLNNEYEFSPASMYIDGAAGNASKSLWGMRSIGTRYATYEMFRVRLDRCSRITFYSSHIEGRGSAKNKDTNGNYIDTNNNTKYSYGDICGTKNTGSVNIFDAARNTISGIIPHFYGDTFVLESYKGIKTVSKGSYYGSEDMLDLRGDNGVRIRHSGNVTGLEITAEGVSTKLPFTSATELDLRGVEGVKFRDGNVTTGTLTKDRFTINATESVLSGVKITSGNGTPSLSGNIGDLYVDKVEGDVYVRVRGKWSKLLKE